MKAPNMSLTSPPPRNGYITGEHDRTKPSERRERGLTPVSAPRVGPSYWRVRRLIRSIKRLRLRSGRKRIAYVPCDATGLAAGITFRCYRPRDEPHLSHIGFSVSPSNPKKSYTF